MIDLIYGMGSFFTFDLTQIVSKITNFCTINGPFMHSVNIALFYLIDNI